MATQELHKAGWSSYFNQLSRAFPREAELRISSAELGSQIEVEGQSVEGITYDHKSDIFVIAVRGLEHIINHPQNVFTDSADGQVGSLQITGADGVNCLVQFRQAFPFPPKISAQDVVDEAGRESFPASDPPPWSGG